MHPSWVVHNGIRVGGVGLLEGNPIQGMGGRGGSRRSRGGNAVGESRKEMADRVVRHQADHLVPGIKNST